MAVSNADIILMVPLAVFVCLHFIAFKKYSEHHTNLNFRPLNKTQNVLLNAIFLNCISVFRIFK